MEVRNRAVSLTGSTWFPVCAALCVFPTTAVGFTLLCAAGPRLPQALIFGMGAFLFVFFALSLVFSSLGLMSLTVMQGSEFGTLTVFGRKVPFRWLWRGYLLAFLTPWLSIALVVTLASLL